MDKIRLLIEEIVEPNSKKTIKELNILKDITILDKDIVKVVFFNTTKEVVNSIKISVAKVVKQTLLHNGVIVDLVSPLIKEETETKLNKPDYIYIAVESGKGGVGKSVVAANIALSISRLTESTVGIIDCDVYGPTIPLLFNREDAKLTGVGELIFPEKVDNIEILSTAFLLDGNSPVMWRAPMLSKLLKSFFESSVFSADVKFIVVDMPPGTGDVSIDLKTLAPNSHVLIVSTRDKIASSIALKAGLGAKQLGLDILGVVENMTHYVESDISVFGDKETGIEKQLDTELLGSIPFIKGDKLVVGKMSVYFDLIVKRILDKLNFKY